MADNALLARRRLRRMRRLGESEVRVAAQLQRIILRIVWAGMTVLVLIGVGTLGFYHIAGDNGNWSDALYMTLISISTVGYGEIVPLHSLQDRLFAGFIAIAGLGALTFLFTSLSVFFLEKDLDYSLRRDGWKSASRSCGSISSFAVSGVSVAVSGGNC
jgi:voltage-gated potassium channel